MQLRRELPGNPADSTTVLLDRVTYENSDPWPENLNGTGQSLTRTAADAFGAFASSWRSERRSPGSTNFQASIPGDVTQDGRVDVEDIDRLCLAVHEGLMASRFDLDDDGQVTINDVQFLLDEILNVGPGDADLNGVFDSSDLVQVFRAAEYEDDVAENSTWAGGDWNCDREFDSSDLVVAFRAGGYSRASAPVARLSRLPLPVVEHEELLSSRDQRPNEAGGSDGLALPAPRQEVLIASPAESLDPRDADEERRRKRAESKRAESDMAAVDRIFEHLL